MKAVMMVLALTASVSNFTAAIQSRSSFLQTTKDRYLVGHVISDHRKVSSISSCAQLCLKRRPSCRSINYGGEEGETICELNDKGLESASAESSSFVSMPGFVFAQLLNFEVSADESLEMILTKFLPIYRKATKLSSAFTLSLYIFLSLMIACDSKGNKDASAIYPP